jgi:hypothetical protein
MGTWKSELFVIIVDLARVVSCLIAMSTSYLDLNISSHYSVYSDMPINSVTGVI